MALKPLTLAAALGMTLSLATPAAQAVSTFFSIDAASPSTAFGITAADILTPGPIGGTPTVFLPGAFLGLMPGDDLDALAFLSSTYSGGPHFSVDRTSVGFIIPPVPNVASEAEMGQAAGDIYAHIPGGNSLATNQDVLGLIPALPAGTSAAPPIDNLDALEYAPDDFFPSIGGLMFSLAAGSPTLDLIGATAADILVWTGPGTSGVFMTGASLGLTPADDLDALAFVGGIPYFSLAAGSPSLATFGATEADILAPGGVITFSAFALGLGPLDNVDALAAIPEPETYAMMLAGLGLLGVMTRLRRRD